MQYFIRKAGSTSQILPISVYDSSSTVGAKLAGLVYNSGSLTAYYNRIGAAGAATAITLVTATKGTWTSSGFVAVDGTNMPGDYELHIPDAALAAGAVGVLIQLKGAANMVPVNAYVDLTLLDLQSATVDVGKLNGSAAAAARLALSAGVIVPGTVTSTGFAPTTTEFEASDIADAAADHYNGRIVIFTSGTLLAQATKIEDYALSTGRGHFTVMATSSAPANGVTFVIV